MSIFVLQALILAVWAPPIILGIAIAANAPRIKTTIISSTNVNPFSLRITLSFQKSNDISIYFSKYYRYKIQGTLTGL
jgi:hypothetical protein